MNHLFYRQPFITVPDGTEVAQILASDSVSIAEGRIAPGTNSAIHLHPFVEQVTHVLSGTLTLRMQDSSQGTPYDLTLKPGQSSLCRPGTAFQLCNPSSETVSVLYIVTPAFRFKMEGDTVTYNDAIMLGTNWDETTQSALIKAEDPAFRNEMRKQRDAALTPWNQRVQTASKSLYSV